MILQERNLKHQLHFYDPCSRIILIQAIEVDEKLLITKEMLLQILVIKYDLKSSFLYVKKS